MKTKFLAIAFLALLPFAASADAPSYSYFDVSIQQGTFDVPAFFDFDTDGYALKGSFAVNDNWYVQFDYTTMGTDPDIGDFSEYGLAAGWHNEMWFARFGYASAEEPLGSDGSGYLFDVGVRTMVSDGFEFNAHIGMSDQGDFGSATFYGFGAVWSFSDSMGLSFNYDLRTVGDFAAIPGFDIDTTGYGLGLRFTFD